MEYMQKLLFAQSARGVKKFRYEKNSGLGDEFSKWEEKGRQQQQLQQIGKM